MGLMIPESLLPGDTIGIAAPAGPVEAKDMEQGIRILESAGFRVYAPEGLFEKSGYLAGDDMHRAGILHHLFADDSVKAIICARGGYGSLRILPLLDYELIRRHPKIFIGFSDITALLSVLQEKCEMLSFHGPVLITLKEDDSLIPLFQSLSSEPLLRIRAENPTVIQPGRAEGRMDGGNLATLCHLTGTSFHPRFEGKIVLLEDWNEPLYKIDRMLTQMKSAGCFRGIRGLILGSFTHCGPEPEIHSLIKDIFIKEEFPILAGFAFGHGSCNRPLPMGADARMDTDSGELLFFGPFTRRLSV